MNTNSAQSFRWISHIWLLLLSATAAIAQVPVINSSTEATATQDSLTPFEYTITATNTPTSFAAVGLGQVSGLSLDSGTGEITGTPGVFGVFIVELTAENGSGTSAPVDLVLTVNKVGGIAPIPTVTSSATITGEAGVAFNYQIVADANPASYSASGLPAGLSIDPLTGAITGFPALPGVFDVTLQATNAAGTGELVAQFTINRPGGSAPIPIISSATEVNGEVGVAFSSQINADGNPASYDASGLPDGLSIDTVTGEITGTPTTVGIFDVTLEATNAAGTGEVEAIFTITVGVPPVISITSPLGGASFNAGDAIDLEIDASDGDGFVTQIEVFANGSFIGTADFASPGKYTFEFLTTVGDVGNLKLSATVTDNDGNEVSDDVDLFVLPLQNQPPVVEIISPLEDAEAPAESRLVIDIEASDADGGFITTIEILADGISVGFASFVAPGEYSFEFIPSVDNLGDLLITARATDNQGTRGSDTVTVGVRPPTIIVELIEPTEDQTIVADESITFKSEVESSAEVLKVEYFIDNVFVGESSEEDSNFELEVAFAESGVFRVSAIATNISDVTSARSNEIEVTVNPRNALLRDEDFILQTFADLFNREPREQELEDGLNALDGTVGARADYLAALLTSVTEENVEVATMIYRTMTAEWPDSEALNQALEDLLGSSTGGSSFDGTLNFGINEVFTFGIPQGAVVTASVVGDISNGFELVDPTLTIFAPNGSLVAFDDDSGIGLDPEITFTASIGGTYRFVVGEFGSNDSGDFTLTISSSSLGGIGVANPDALTQALVPEYEARFSALNTDNGFLTQVFENKHLGATPTNLNVARLSNALVTTFGSSLTQFTTQFALDNIPSNLEGPNGNPLSRNLLYEFPNTPIDLVPYAHALAGLLRASPTDSAVENAAAQDLTAFLESLLANSDYYERFDGDDSTAGQVVQYMASFGVFDNPNVNVADLAPDADFDGDGDTNEEEMDAQTDPTQGSGGGGGGGGILGGFFDLIISFFQAILNFFTGLFPFGDEAIVEGPAPKLAPVENIEKAYVGDSFAASKAEAVEFRAVSEESEESPVVIEGYLVVSDSKGLSNEKTLIITYVQPVDFDQIFLVECSSDSTFWDLAKPISSEDVLVVDQTGVDEGSERIEFRATFDNSSDECNFFRIGY